jgi:hypothetical protein
MGLLDLPRGLISRLPLIGGSGDDKKPADEPVAAMPEDPATDRFDEPDEDEPDDDQADVEEDEPDDDQDEPGEDEPDDHEDEPHDAENDVEEDEPEEAASSTSVNISDTTAPSIGPNTVIENSTSVNISDTTAPSIGPNTVIEKDTPEERLARHDQSSSDAMGLDKRRSVVGGSYSASFGKQLTRWALVVLVIAAGAFGAKLLVDDIDKAPAHAADRAPWSGSQQPPKPLE